MKTLYLFDFDHTIYNGDSMLDFTKFINKKRYYFSVVLLAFPWLCNKFGIVSVTWLKTQFLKVNIGGKKEEELIKLASDFYLAYQKKVRQSFILFLESIDRTQSDCYVVSASSELWLTPFSHAFNCQLIATDLEIQAGIITGKLASANRKGEEKVKAIRQYIELSNYANIECFGDGSSDKKMKEIATNYYSNYFQ